jgi:hypothetical protein
MSLLNEASFLVTPNGYKEDKLYAAIPTNGDGDMTVTRATTATRVNEAGLVELVPYNLLLRSQEFNNDSFTTTRSQDIETDSRIAPDGTLTADTWTGDGAAGSHSLAQTVSITSGVAYTQSVFAKKGTNNFLQIVGTITIYDSDSWANFDLENGDVGNVGTSATATITDFGNGWYRCTMTATATATALSNGFLLWLITSATSARVESNSLDTSVHLWGAQVVKGSSALTYQKTVDRLDIPRIDYTGGGCPSILLEPQRTNLALYSEKFEGTNWAGGSTVVTQNDSIAPSGEQTAVKLQRTSTSGGYRSHTRYKSTSAITYTTSVFVKQGEDNFFAMRSQGLYPSRVDIRFRFDTGLIYYAQATSGFTLIDYGVENYSNGWYRIYYTYTTDAHTYSAIYFSPRETDGNIDGIDTSSNSFVYVWGAQLEEGAYPTSYIPTTTIALARNADGMIVDNIRTNNLITDAGGTWFVHLINNVPYKRDAFNVGISIRSVSSSTSTSGVDSLEIRNTASTLQRLSIGKRISGAYSGLFETTTDTVKFAIKWNGITTDVFVNGAPVASGSAFTATDMEFLGSNGNDVSKYIKQMALFPTPLHDDECIALTTL